MKIENLKTLRREVLAILIFSAFLALAYNTFSGRGLSLIRSAPARVGVPDSVLFPQAAPPDSSRIAELLHDTTRLKGVKVIAPLHERALKNPDSLSSSSRTNAEPVYRTVTLAQVQRLLAQGRAFIIDARAPGEFQKGHIRGSINVFGENPGDHFGSLAVLPRDTLVVIYCNGPLCPLARMVADFMTSIEFHNLYLYDDGWEGWAKARMDIDTAFTAKGGG